ncbi:hypothetical protein ASPCADRAFT_206104 [Aspergillus carbonarius ITEM 5010]|uniref:Uncharacterized protein n=1 Tax=Aspergillus carbonarius (strain ITEM 5010) TaxID=602072 RepID=A0A1R3RS13_ASPC5|nr:hypothetical protein ASPCADRAFT_206104 [Aspergillus carbonarius ITEM 5010]
MSHHHTTFFFRCPPLLGIISFDPWYCATFVSRRFHPAYCIYTEAYVPVIFDSIDRNEGLPLNFAE